MCQIQENYEFREYSQTIDMTQKMIDKLTLSWTHQKSNSI